MKRHFKSFSLVKPDKACNPAAQGCESQWVQLIILPDRFSYDQALLIQQQSADEWVAWIPDYGEVRLHSSEFYFVWDWN